MFFGAPYMASSDARSGASAKGLEVLRVNGSGRSGLRRFGLLWLAALIFGSVAGPALRPAPARAAEEKTATDAQVAEGLKLIQDIAAEAAERDKDKATQIADGIEDVWKNIEDTVRGNDKDAYITFEDSFESLGSAAKAGDAAKAAKASEAIAAAVKTYLAKHPGDAPPAPAAASAPAPGPAR